MAELNTEEGVGKGKGEKNKSKSNASNFAGLNYHKAKYHDPAGRGFESFIKALARSHDDC